MSDLFGNLISCVTCSHGIGAHDGGGCHVTDCGCGHSMQIVMDQNIALFQREIQQQWRLPE